jgi:hypothetical protein
MTNSINFTPLELKLTTMFNVPVLIESNGKSRPTISHDNIMPQIGIFSHCIFDASIDFFNYNIDADGNLWGTIYLSYESLEGGSNGMKVLTCWYTANTQDWKFESTKK